jgi:uncharacterized membrane protein
LLFAVFIRSINIGKFGLYGDEKYSIMVVNGISWEGATQKKIFEKNEKGELINKYFTPKQFWDELTFSDFDEAIMRTDNGNSATFYGLLYVWKSIFGQSDGALRWMGVLFDCGTILLLFFFCKNILGLPIVGLISAFFGAIEPFLIAYSHQVRNYPVGIFLTLLSAYLFFKILKNESDKKVNYWLYFGYGATVILGILCHFYVVLFIFSQFIVLVISQFRKLQVVKRFVITYIISFFFLGLWFTIGGGRATYATFKEKDIIHINMANDQTGHANEFSNVSLTSFSTIYSKVTPIFIDNFILTNDLFSHLNGKLNFIICLILSSFLCFILVKSDGKISSKNNLLYSLLALGIVATCYLLFSHNPLYYIYLSFIFVLLFVILKFFFQDIHWKNGYHTFSFITLLLPTILTILAAIKSGHTANIYQKYLSFGLPISFIFMAIGIWQLANYSSYLKYIFLAAFGCYLIKIHNIDYHILHDNYPKYTIMAEPRAANPYILVANKLEKLYQPGDTIIYPNTGHATFDQYDAQMKSDYVSIIDAQMTNIYLPKQANFIQRVEPLEGNKLYLYQLKTKSKLLIFDFGGKKFRY